MSTAKSIDQPIDYIIQTFGLSIIYTVVIGSFSLFALAHLYSMNPQSFRFGLFAVLGLAFLGSQLEMRKNNNDEASEFGIIEKLTLFVGAFLIYNGIIGFAGVVGTIIDSVGYPSLAIFVSFIYPLWERETANRSIPIPLSFLGIATFLGWIAIKIGLGARERLTLIRDNVDLPLELLEQRIGQLFRPSL